MKRHNKRRNSALLYEFLVKHISKCLVNDKKEEALKTVAISKKYFFEGSPLKKELSLFRVILDNKVENKDSAFRILDSVCKSGTKMNARILDEQKSKLIKDINHTLKEENFYNYKVPNYTIYASLQTLINESRNKNKTLNIVDQIKIEENIINYLTEKKEKNENLLKIDSNYSNTVYNFLVQKFNKKYEGKLNESQKKLLTQYVVGLISNKQDSLREYMHNEVLRIKNSLSNIKDESLSKDKDLMNKIFECKNKFSNFTLDVIDEQKVLEMLQYMRLVEELEN